MHWTPAAVAAATSGRLASDPVTPAGTKAFGSVAIDSRTIEEGALFVPIKAERDGHDFVAAAVGRGAAGYLFEAGRLGAGVRPPGLAIEVADTSRALLDLGLAARHRLAGPVVGVTGSVGKTSTKDLASAALAARWRVAASERSWNNELGVPLTLANAPEDTEVAVIEMGARGEGHIALLCAVAHPTIAVVTAVVAAHTELFGTIEAVAAAKGELVEGLPSSGTAVLNADDPRVAAMSARTAASVLWYSAAGADADIVALDVRVGDDLRPSLRLASPWGTGTVTLGVRGAHQVGNALAAAAVALRCEVPLEAVLDALGHASLSPWRMELSRAPAGAMILNDAYNANPASMTAALQALAELPARRRIAVLGLMAELGPSAPAAHRAIASLAADLDVAVVAFRTADYGVEPVEDLDAALVALGSLGDGDAVLVKGSRVAGLERLAVRLLAAT